MANDAPLPAARLQRAIDLDRDHVRGNAGRKDSVKVVLYGDYLCPYCRRLRSVLTRLRQALGDRLAYVFRHYPNERSHPGAEFASRAAEAAARQGRFWEMYDALYGREPPLNDAVVRELARNIGLDMAEFEKDVADPHLSERVQQDLDDGKRNGVTGTPTIFVDGIRYDGAWDFYSMLEALERPVAARLQRRARVFASLPASAGLVLLLAAAAALICANSPLASYYRQIVDSSFAIGFPGAALSLTIGEWCSEGLLAVFFLLVGLEIRREMTAGALANPRAAILPIVAAVGGVLAPTAIYLLINRGPTAAGWAVPTATDIAFALGILALLGSRVPSSLRVFVASLAVVDDVLSMLTLAIFYPRSFDLAWLVVSAACVTLLFALNRARVYSTWPYALVVIALWIALHSAGIHAALAGIFLAALLPTRPTPQPGPLLAQAATALATLEQAETQAHEGGTKVRIDQEPVWDWASRQLSAATDRLLSPADRIERAVAPWSAYLILPMFAFSASGISLAVDLSSREAQNIVIGVILGLAIGKPLGISLASLAAIKTRLALAPDNANVRLFLGAACLCGIGDTVSLLMADQAFPGSDFSSVAKIGVLLGSFAAATLGTILILAKRNPRKTIAPTLPDQPVPSSVA